MFVNVHFAWVISGTPGEDFIKRWRDLTGHLYELVMLFFVDGKKLHVFSPIIIGSVENYLNNERKLILEIHPFFLTKNHAYGRKGIFSQEYLLIVDVFFFASDRAKMFWGRGLYKYFLFWLAFGNVWGGICAPVIPICFMTTTHALKKQVMID